MSPKPTSQIIKDKVKMCGLLPPCTILACKGEGLISSGIQAVSKSPYSHIDIVYMSSIVGGLPMHVLAGALPAGFIPTTFNRYWNDPDGLTDFDVYKLKDLTPERTIAMIKFMESKLERVKYNWTGVAHFILPFIKSSKTREFCSQITCEMFKAGGYLDVSYPSSECKPSDLVKFNFLEKQ